MNLVGIGDSLTYGYKVKRSEVWTKLVENKYGVKVLNKGINGDSTGGMLSRFYRDVIENSPSHVLIMGGTNDFIMEVPLNIVRSNIASMVHHAYGNNIVPIIGIQILTEPEMAKKYWSGITDFSRVNEEIMQYREWAFEFGSIFNVQVIDFCTELNKYITEENKYDYYIDGLHLTSKGNEILANVVKVRGITEKVL